jgi:hypothetical protein
VVIAHLVTPDGLPPVLRGATCNTADYKTLRMLLNKMHLSLAIYSGPGPPWSLPRVCGLIGEMN